MASNHATTHQDVLHKLAEACPVGLVAVDRSGTIVVANMAAEQLFGYATQELEGLPVDRLFPKRHQADYTQLRENRWNNPNSQSATAGRNFVGVHKSGREVPIEIGFTRFEAAGESYVLASMFDLTDRKQLEAELQRSNDETQIVLDSLPSLVFLKDRDNRILRVNRAAAESRGLPKEAIEGKHSRDIYPEDADRFHKDDLEVIASGEPKLGYVEPVGDRWVQTDKAPVRGREGEVDRIIVVATDITEQRRAIESEKLLQRLLEKTGEIARIGGWEVDLLNGGDPIWSPEVCRIHEVPEGHTPTLEEAIAYYLPESRKRIEQAVQQCIDTYEPWDIEATIKTAKGNVRQVRAVGAPEVRDGQCVRLWGALQDITQQHEASQNLRLMEYALDKSTNAIFFIRSDGFFSYANEQAAHDLGYSREELCGMGVSDINHPFAGEHWREHWARTRELGELVYESKHQRKDGSSLDCEIRESFLNFGGEELIVATLRDITEAKLARQRLAESEDRYSWAMRNGNLGLWDWDLATNEVLFSDVTKTQLGYPADAEWRSFDEWESRLHPDDYEEAVAKAKLLAVNPRDVYDSTFRLRTASGDYRWIRSIGKGVFDDAGQLKRCIGVHLDVTEARESQKELQRSENRYRTLYENSPVMHANVSPDDGGIRDCNDLLVKRLGFESKDEIVGKPIFDLYDPACHDAVHGAFDAFVATGRVENAELTLQTPGGEKVPVILNVAAVRDAQGKIVHSSSTWVDVTDLRQKTEDLKRANEELERFAYITSHDLKAPLRAIDNLAKWLADDLTGQLPEASEEHLMQLRQRVSRMERLLDDVLAYSRAGQRRGDIVEIDLRELINDCHQLLDLPTTFNVTAELEKPTIVGHETPLETVIRNLVGNAVKHHDKQAGTISVLQTVDERDHRFAKFTVADDGPGIEDGLREKAFAMFQTLKPRDEVEGSGMGLALAKKLIESEGGHAWIEANSPRGTCVNFTWPLNLTATSGNPPATFPGHGQRDESRGRAAE